MPARFEPGTLRRSLAERTLTAIESGDLHTIETEPEHVSENGIPFVVRVAANLRRKRVERARRTAAERTSGEEFNPFLPPEKALTVCDISDTHVGVLNKFNVVSQHLLLVTREFEDQQRLLSVRDFEAMWLCLSEYPSLGFYNGGETAGASQRHKHLQVVPLPLCEGVSSFPFDALLADAPRGESLQTIDWLPFRHAFCRISASGGDEPSRLAEHTEGIYRRMLAGTGIRVTEAADGERQGTPYNLIVTKAWMLMVPRFREFSHGISVNGLGFAGSLFVIDREGLETVRRVGPMQLLKDVSFPEG